MLSKCFGDDLLFVLVLVLVLDAFELLSISRTSTRNKLSAISIYANLIMSAKDLSKII